MSRTRKSARRVKRSADSALVGPEKKQQKAQSAEEASTTADVAVYSEQESRQEAERTLTKLLGGMCMETFQSEYFEKRPLHVRAAEKSELFADGLFSRNQLLEVLEKESPSLKVGKDLTVCRYVNSQREDFDCAGGDGSATSQEVDRLLDSGFSCQFYQPQRYTDGLYAINAAFEEVFGGLAGASAYLTPANAQALAPHYDDVEVFVLQTQGRKKWQLYRPLVELAGEHSSDLAVDQIGEPWMQLTVEEGDVLYFPRGVVHQACTDEKEFSTHVTISVYQHNTWANFLEVALPRVIRQAFDSDIAFRQGLPMKYLSYMGTQFPTDSAKAKDFTASCKKLVGRLAAHVDEKDLQQAADEAALDVLANRLPPPGTKENDEAGLSPLDDNVVLCFKNRSHIRLSMGEDETKEAFVAVYYSQHNCRRHHMGFCTCNGQEEDEDCEENSDDGDAEASSADGDQDGHGDSEEEDDPSAAFGQMPAQPKSIVFPGELAAALMKLYSSSASAGHGVPIDELVEANSDETAVRGMLLRLWSEGLLDVSTRSQAATTRT
ncbi:unnamed protein product [Hyaloperonospora brassicae]|uniref:Bifunctional lysine-specific demethylase and histidyl-hydroxylase n=1 Tax=Hyaloperonospora brassicae TaxID=162125 RepID=A0AAV0T430_HYABA|nr:unnamed protein product [Hyaloperonospora brassicae]